MVDLEKALGQFSLYRAILERTEPDRLLFLAIPEDAAPIFDEPIGQLVIEEQSVQCFVFDLRAEEIIRWIP